MQYLITRGFTGKIITRGMGGAARAVQKVYKYWQRIYTQKGERFFELSVPIYGDTVQRFQFVRGIFGDVVNAITEAIKIISDVLIPVNILETQITGDVSHNFNDSIKLTGKKGFKNLILQMLLVLSDDNQ